jgi:hypothetical protein
MVKILEGKKTKRKLKRVSWLIDSKDCIIKRQ